MRLLARPSSLVLIIVGVLFAVFPLFSAARLSSHALAQLPPEGRETSVDDRHLLALFSDDFTVATRTYSDKSVDELRDIFLADGFESSGRNRYAVPCCGDYDGIWVTLAETPDGTTASLAPIDTDFQSTWPAFPILSLLVVGVGLGLINSRRSAGPAEHSTEEPLVGAAP